MAREAICSKKQNTNKTQRSEEKVQVGLHLGCFFLQMAFVMFMDRISTASWGMMLEFPGAVGDRCDSSADYLEVYLSGKLPALRCLSVCLQR
ncbi:hypothetical protein CRENBAI_009387, partial [Crenichthys baileyi]